LKHLVLNIIKCSFLLFGIFTCHISAQDQNDLKFDRLTTENLRYEKGLSQNWIYSILQDQYGYMWFGTWEGLNKYDGYNFTIYNTSSGLSNHTIYSLLEDDEGYLWIGTDKGFNKFNRKTQQFRSYFNDPPDSVSLYHNRINAIIQTDDGAIWLGTGAGLIRFDKDTETREVFLSTPQEYTSPRSNYITHLYEDNNGFIWVSTTYGLVKFDPRNGRSTRYYHIPENPNSLSNNNVRCVIQEKSGNYWIGTRSGLSYYDTITQKTTHYFHKPNDPNSLSSSWIRTIFEDSSGRIWIGTEAGGLCQYVRERNNFIRYQNSLNDNNSLSNDRVYSIYEDLSGNIWVGTYKGVNRINKYFNYFEHVHQTTNDNRSPNSNFIWSFYEDPDKNLWIGTSEGISIKDKETGLFTYLTHDPESTSSLALNDVRKILYTPGYNCFWFAVWESGLDRYDPVEDHFTHYVPNPNRNSLSFNYVNDIIADPEGLLWIATGRGLNCFDPQSGLFKVFYHESENENSISNDVVICLFIDSKQNLWIGTDNGLNKYLGNGNFINYLHETGNDSSLSNNTIFYITEDRTGNIWVGTSGGGLNRLNPESGIFKAYTVEDGLPNNVVYGILEDKDQNLWISTNRGLSKLYTISERFVNYDVKDGIQSNEFNLGACFTDSEGMMYFGGMNGYNVFNPEKIRYNPKEPVVVFSAFRKFNDIQPIEYHDGDTIRLMYDDNFFSIEISALDFTNPSKNKYRYKLDNFDENWIFVDADNRIAEYKKVSPGTYTFMAMGSNNDGVWNEEPISLSIIIKPPWWETWIFRILLALIVIAGLWILIYRRIKRIRKKHEVEKRLLEIEKQKFDLEQKALRLQMNPHFIFNSLNSIQSYILTHDPDKAIRYLGKFSQLMRLILTNSSNKFVPINDEIKSIGYYMDLEQLRFENKFEYQINFDKNIDEEFIEIPPMIVQPYIENAIIHGLIHKKTKGKILLDFKLDGDKIICTIEDNGIGREKAAEIARDSGIKRKSRGMLITQSRLQILNRNNDDDFSVRVIDLMDNFGKPAGTRVELFIYYRD